MTIMSGTISWSFTYDHSDDRDVFIDLSISNKIVEKLTSIYDRNTTVIDVKKSIKKVRELRI